MITIVACLRWATVLTAAVAFAVATEAGITGEYNNFYAQLPKHVPRMGRSQGVYLPKRQHHYFYAQIPRSMPRVGRSDPRLQHNLFDSETDESPITSSIKLFIEKIFLLDSNEDGCLSVRELLHIPMIRNAILMGDVDSILPSQEQRGFRRFRDSYEEELEKNMMGDSLQ